MAQAARTIDEKRRAYFDMHRRTRSLRELHLQQSVGIEGQRRILRDLLRHECFNPRAAEAKLHT